MSDRQRHPSRRGGQPAFAERLRVPWWWWFVAAGVGTLIAAQIHLGYPGLREWLPYLLTIPATWLVLLWLSRVQVQVADGELRVGPARLPVQWVGEVEVVPAWDKQRALGPDSDPASYILHRGWVGPMLRVHLTDPDDPTPYWIFSVRRPHALADALRAARTQQAA